MTGGKFEVESFGHDKRAAQFTMGGCCDTLTSTDYKDPCIVAYPVQNHPQDSRVTIEEDASTVQTLNAKMGTGGATRRSSSSTRGGVSGRLLPEHRDRMVE